jgi:hypothetical protein
MTPRRHRDRAARRSVANRVADQIEDDLPSPFFVALNRQAFVGSRKESESRRLLRDGLHKLHAAAHAGSQIDRRQARAASASGC